MGWRIASFVMLVVIFLAVVQLLVVVCNLPGKIARERNHPQAKAIEVSAWLGLVTGMVTWVIAAIWAQMIPSELNSSGLNSSGAGEQ